MSSHRHLFLLTLVLQREAFESRTDFTSLLCITNPCDVTGVSMGALSAGCKHQKSTSGFKWVFCKREVPIITTGHLYHNLGFYNFFNTCFLKGLIGNCKFLSGRSMFQVGSFTSARPTIGTRGTGKWGLPRGVRVGLAVLGVYGEHPRCALCHGGENTSFTAAGTLQDCYCHAQESYSLKEVFLS